MFVLLPHWWCLHKFALLKANVRYTKGSTLLSTANYHSHICTSFSLNTADKESCQEKWSSLERFCALMQHLLTSPQTTQYVLHFHAFPPVYPHPLFYIQQPPKALRIMNLVIPSTIMPTIPCMPQPPSQTNLFALRAVPLCWNVSASWTAESQNGWGPLEVIQSSSHTLPWFYMQLEGPCSHGQRKLFTS